MFLSSPPLLPLYTHLKTCKSYPSTLGSFLVLPTKVNDNSYLWPGSTPRLKSLVSTEDPARRFTATSLRMAPAQELRLRARQQGTDQWVVVWSDRVLHCN